MDKIWDLANKRKRQWTIINGNVIDITNFIHKHPGGDIIKSCIGIDSTVLYYTHHPFYIKEFEPFLEQLKVDTKTINIKNIDKILNNCNKRSKLYEEFINTLDKKKNDYNTWLKCKGFFLISLISFLVYFHSSGYILASCILPFVYYMFASQIMHESGHRSGNHSFNKFFRIFSSLIGMGGTPSWVYKHNRHHAITNCDNDPELNLLKIVRLNRNRELLYIHTWSHYYIWILYSLLHLDIFFDNFFPQPKTVKNIPIHERNTLEAKYSNYGFIFIYFILPFILGGGLRSIFYELVFFIPASLLISLLFQVSHVSMKTNIKNVNRNDSNDWFINQLNNSCNYSINNYLLTEMFGGLNFQIEHHLFPTVIHSSLPNISKKLRKFCKNKKLSYNLYNTFWDAIVGHYKVIKYINT